MRQEEISALYSEINSLEAGQVLVRQNISDYVYHQSPGYGSTAIREACKSMAHFKLYLEADREPTPDMILGQAIHTLTLEPDLFFDRFVIAPEDLTPGNNNAWKAWKAAQSKTIITRAQMKVVGQTSESVMTRAHSFFSGGQAEKSYWRRDPSGLILKARIDYEKGDLGIDLKSTKAENKHKFMNTIKYDYAIQDALYRLVTGLADLVFIGVCKTPPHAIYGGKQSEKERGYALASIETAINQILIAEEFNDYPLPPIEILETN